MLLCFQKTFAGPPWIRQQAQWMLRSKGMECLMPRPPETEEFHSWEWLTAGQTLLGPSAGTLPHVTAHGDRIMHCKRQFQQELMDGGQTNWGSDPGSPFPVPRYEQLSPPALRPPGLTFL